MSPPTAPSDAPSGADSPVATAVNSGGAVPTGAGPVQDVVKEERRAPGRRGAAWQRAAWMSSRARNATRRGPLIASVGGIVVIATLLVLVLLPREVDRALRVQLARIPASRDTAPLLAALEGARTRNAAAQTMARSTRVAANPSAVAPVASALGSAGDSSVLARDTVGVELQQRLTRARAAPLAESYRALAESPLVQADSRVRAIVDSLDQTDREREAYAALGGPDARYAALTARLAALGGRIVRIAEAKLAERQQELLARAAADATSAAATAAASVTTVSGAPVTSTTPPANATTPPAGATVTPPAAPSAPGAVPPVATGGSVSPGTGGTGSVTATTPPGVPAAAGTAADSTIALGAGTPLLATRVEVVDTALVNAAAALADTVLTLERSLAVMRRTNAANEERRAAVRVRTGVAVPPIAMLVAALVVGLAIGYGSAIVRELRRPTVGDEGEVERLTHARVIVHAGSHDATRDVRTRRRADRALSPALDPTAEAWQQLHLTLTGLGDVVRSARVIADQPLLGATLTINLAAAAARESRATLVVEAPSRTPLLSSLLRQNKPRGLLDVQQGRAELRETITEVPIGRDVAIDVMFAGAPVRNAPPVANRSELGEELRRVAARYDLALVMGDESADVGIAAHDVIVCARLGVTSLEWLSRVTIQARSSGHRLRAVLLWATDTPTV
ncbi:MAG: hypothetical protein V4617_08980 [Gemmatimonadota bacterium]